jgi:hypothetical protein
VLILWGISQYAINIFRLQCNNVILYDAFVDYMYFCTVFIYTFILYDVFVDYTYFVLLLSIFLPTLLL